MDELPITGSHLEVLLSLLMEEAELPPPEREYRFARAIAGDGPGLRQRLAQAGLKDWRFDFAWPQHKVAVEVEGGIWSRGRHVRGVGFQSDCQKYNTAVLAGWTVLRFTEAMILDGSAVAAVRQALDGGNATIPG